MDVETIRRLNLARHLYELGVGSLRSANDMHLFSAVNLMQDAIEAFLLGIADHVGAPIDPNTKFDKYFTLIDSKIAPKELPFKAALLRLNRIRVDSKHYGIQPARDECERLSVAVREFFEEVCATLVGAAFSTVSAIDLLKDGDTKTALSEARIALETGDLAGCAVGCRKALYLEIEKQYDTSDFKDDDASIWSFSKAPLYAKNKQYIEASVSEPTDYIVYDHSSVNEHLLTHGVDNVAFWNVWRLTPEVYRSKDGTWVVKQEFAKLDTEVLKAKIEYIFSATLDVVLSIHKTSQATQWAQNRRYSLELKQEAVPVHKKADSSSEISGHTPPGMTKIDTDYYVDGLNGDGPYWHVMHFEKDRSFIWGFIHNDFAK